jgi:hypothetical protein
MTHFGVERCGNYVAVLPGSAKYQVDLLDENGGLHGGMDHTEIGKLARRIEGERVGPAEIEHSAVELSRHGTRVSGGDGMRGAVQVGPGDGGPGGDVDVWECEPDDVGGRE